MRYTGILIIIILLFKLLSCSPQVNEQDNMKASPDESSIRKVHEDYVQGWRSMDEKKVMSLLVEEAMIQPNKMNPIVGKEKIREFWFPNDGSKTIINDFQTEIISINVFDTIAITTHKSHLDWTYEKDTVRFGAVQKGINTTIYKKQENDAWKIWRSMWTDF